MAHLRFPGPGARSLDDAQTATGRLPNLGLALVLLFLGVGLAVGTSPAQAQLPQTIVGSNCSACNPVAADTADVNQDGAMDVLVVSQNDSTVAWYENDGSGSFTKNVITTGVHAIHTVEGADFDGDGDIDVLADDKWYDNDGGAWTERTVGTGGGSLGPAAVQSVDLDQNGTVDIVSVQRTESGENGLVWYSNQGGGSFSSQKVIATGVPPKEELQVADLDGKNGLDIVVTGNVPNTTDEQIVWFPNQGDDTFGARQQIEQEKQFDYLEVTDIDNDENADVVAGVLDPDISDNYGVEWYESDGTPSDGGWTTHLVSDSIDSDIYALHVDDVDQNGTVDVLAGSRRDQVHLYENDGSPASGEEWAVQTITSRSGAVDVATADFDGDSQTDIFYAARTDGRAVWVRNDGMGMFPRVSNQFPVTTLENSAGSYQVADVDGDQNNEIVTGGSYILWYEENGMGGYSANVVSFRASGADVVDLDGDGDQDILGLIGAGDVEYGNNVVWYENDGSGSFLPPKPITDTQAGLESFTTGLVDDDNLPDVVYASTPLGSDTPPGRVVLRTNDGDGTFTTEVIEEEKRFNSVELLDVNGDGDTDVLQQSQLGGPDSNGEIEWYENQGNGDFPTPVGGVDEGTLIAPYSGLIVQASDLDSDGDRDVLISSVGTAPKAFEWYENEDGVSTFRRDTIQTPSPRPREDFDNEEVKSFETGDLDGDGETDVVYARRGNLTWRRNDGSEAFSAHILSSSAIGRPRLGDVNDDGDPDILVKEQRKDPDVEERLTWVENKNLNLPQSPSNLSAQTVPAQNVTRGVDEIKLTWSASPSSDVEQYFIYRERVSFGSPRGLDSDRGPYYYQYALLDSVSAGQTSYVDTDRVLQADSTYHYRVSAVAPFNLESGFTNEVTQTPARPLVAHSLQPRSGGPGTLLRIKGAGFSPQAADHSVTVDDISAPVDSAKTSVVYARIPAASALPDTARGAVNVTLQTEGETRTVAEEFQLVRTGSESFTDVGSNVTAAISRYVNVDWADYDDDGDADLVVVGENASREASTTLYRNDSGTLTPVDQGLADVENAAEWGDYDGDGTIELMLVGFNNTVSLYQNDGSGTLTESLVSSGGNTDGTGIRNDGLDAAFHDYDADGNLDLFVTGVKDNTDGRLYRNDESEVFSWGEPLPDAGTVRVKEVAEFFQPDGTNTTAPIGESVDWGDYNNDGHVDLLTDYGEVYRNRGDGTFQEVDTKPNDPNVRLGITGAAEWGDFDQDGDLDIAIAGSEGFETPAAKIYENKGDGTFEAIGAGLTGAYDAPAVEWGDFTGNGRIDLAVAGRAEDNPDGSLNYETTLYRNDGGGSFTAVNAGLKGMVQASLTAIDVDNDGDLDLLATGRTRPDYERERRLYLNEPPATAETNTVSSDGSQDFGATGTAVGFDGVSGSGDVSVERFDEGPATADGVSEPNVSDYLLTIEAASGLSFSSATVKLAVSSFGGIGDPENVTIYTRPSSGGAFSSLSTMVDDNNTPADISDDTLFATTDSFSDFVLASSSSPLPVELAGFSGEQADGGVRLSWKTLSETGNRGFTVQRQTPGAAGTWKKVGFVESRTESGSTRKTGRYQFVDEDLPYSADSLRYRLKQVDTDGGTAYSQAVTVRRAAVQQLRLEKTFPNPARRQVTLQYAVPQTAAETDVTLRLYDVLGRRVRSVRITGKPGRHEQILTLTSLASGTYFLRLTGGDTVKTRRITIVR